MKYIKIRGAREHNLKNVNVDIPKNRFIVVTGVSGSGKTSLVFDTLYAEAHRRFLESLSSYARQFLGMLKRPDVDSMEGLSPAISIEQHTTSSFTPRSTVGTISEIYDYVRLMFAHIGTPYCPEHGLPMVATSPDVILRTILTKYNGDRVEILAPLVMQKKGDFKNLFDTLLKAGFMRIYVDGELYFLDEIPVFDKNKHHDIYLVVDRVRVKSENKNRILDGIELAWKKADGVVAIKVGDDIAYYTKRHACPICGRSLPELSPRLFSFNSPVGACPVCGGIGMHEKIDPDLLVLDESKSISEGAIFTMLSKDMEILAARACGIDPYVPWEDLPQEQRHKFLFEGSNQPIEVDLGDERWWWKFNGIVNYLEQRYRNTDSDTLREKIRNFMVMVECSACHGTGLRSEALWVKVDGKTIEDVVKMPTHELREWISTIKVSGMKKKVWKSISAEIEKRVNFMVDVGLGYLNLIRKTNTLSGGEAQRLRLAGQLGNVLTGIMYVLDEPTIGLHPRDTSRLIKLLKMLRDKDNTVIVVEHDESVIRNADYVIDMGPGAGEYGGEVVASGTIDEIMAVSRSITGQYLSGKRSISIPKVRRKPRGWLHIVDAHKFNLKHIDVDIPKGVMTVITGVSGSGKSTLAVELLYKYLAKHLNGAHISVSGIGSLKGYEDLRYVDLIDQSPIGKTPRSIPATYVGVFDKIRKLFASLPEAKARGYTAGRFSFNVPPPKGGRCEACKGVGIVKIEMQFLPDVYVTCDVCNGERYGKETLEIKYKGYSIADILDMTVTQAMDVFRNIPSIYNDLKILEEVGLGYIKLGQQSPTLSGGESQRVKLATYLKGNRKGYLFVLDEPTTGLHMDDVNKLLKVLHRLVDSGNTVVIIEHNLDVIANADYIIDMGPEGGSAGGYVIASGTPEEVARNNTYTGRFLREYFESRGYGYED